MPQANSLTAAAIRSFVAAIDSLEDDKARIQSQIKEVYDEAKDGGLDPKVLRKVVRLHRKSKAQRDEEQAVIDAYLDALEGAGEAARAAANRATPPTAGSQLGSSALSSTSGPDVV